MPLARTNAGTRARFGVFEVDLTAGELRKNGSKVRLQEQPFQLLAYLLAQPGEVVTREELRDKLWPADTFVDFDHSLNTAVNKVRDALQDSASSPRFVETLAKRGYRFIAPVEWIDTAAASASETNKPHAANDQIAVHPELAIPLPHRGTIRALFALVQVMYLIFYIVGLVKVQAVVRVTDAFLPGWSAYAAQVVLLVTALAGIPLRLYLLSTVAFDYRGLGASFRRLFPFVLILDLLWAIAPFLLSEKIGAGAAFAATAGLLYVPFAERTLIRMAYHSQQ